MPSTAARLPHRILGLVLLFLIAGQVMLFSATSVMGLQRYGSEFHYVLRQGATALFGLMLLFVVSRIRYQVWARFAYALLGVQIFLVVLTLIPSIAHTAQGATRWIRLGPLAFQPSELTKVTLTIYVATLLTKHFYSRLPANQWFIYGSPVLLLLLLIFRQPDLGTTILLTTITLGLFFIAGARLVYIGGFLGCGAMLFLMAMLHSDYRRKRLFAFLNPWADPQGSGFQMIQSFVSIHSGKLLGVGLGNGNSKLFYLPEVHTDFIFALIGEELGFLGAALFLGLFLYFAYLIYKVAFQARDRFGCYLAFGLATALILQIMVNLGGVTGLLPVKGLPLPFISWGRSALLVDLVMVGILLNIAHQSAIIQKPQ